MTYGISLQENQSLLQSFENCSRSALGTGPWMARFDGELIENLGRYRKYNQSSLRDLLRVIRNKHNHFRELPETLQAKLGPLPQGYFSCAPALSTLYTTADCAAFTDDLTTIYILAGRDSLVKAYPGACRPSWGASARATSCAPYPLSTLLDSLC